MEIPPLPTTRPAADTAPGPQAQTQVSAARESAKEFEAMFLGQMVDEMLSTVEIGNFGGGHAEETWRSFLSDAIGRSIADQGSTGIADGIETAILRYQTGRER